MVKKSCHGEQNRGYPKKELNKLYKKLVPKVTLHFVWGHLSRKQTVAPQCFLMYPMWYWALYPHYESSSGGEITCHWKLWGKSFRNKLSVGNSFCSPILAECINDIKCESQTILLNSSFKKSLFRWVPTESEKLPKVPIVSKLLSPFTEGSFLPEFLPAKFSSWKRVHMISCKNIYPCPASLAHIKMSFYFCLQSENV